MLTKGKVLVVDDDRAVCDSLRKWFESEGYRAQSAAGAEQAMEAVQKERWDVALVDLRMPSVDGIHLQLRLRDLDPDLPVIIMTGYASVETAVRALKNGAYDYIVKPVDPDELVHLVSKTLEHRRARREVAQLRENLREVTDAGDLVGQSPAMKRVNELVEAVSPTDATVLITGERGTGKEMVARAIHARSPRRFMPLVIVHCGVLTEDVADSELFGHEEGAFADAQQRRKGKLEAADGGTVFLDEISELGLKTQSDLVRVLTSKQIVRLGGARPVHTEFRCVAAANRGLEESVRQGEFRSDLYDRINIFAIDLPPLRQRREDLPILVDHFLRKYSATMNRPLPGISKTAMNLLIGYDWPGNVRELQNAIERALLINQEDEIQPADFPFQDQAARERPCLSLAQLERRHIEKVVNDTNWNLSQSARILGIDRTTLYNKLKRYGLR